MPRRLQQHNHQSHELLLSSVNLIVSGRRGHTSPSQPHQLAFQNENQMLQYSVRGLDLSSTWVKHKDQIGGTDKAGGSLLLVLYFAEWTGKIP